MRKRKYLNPIKGPILNKDWGGGGFIPMANTTESYACVSWTAAEWIAKTVKTIVAAPGAGKVYLLEASMVNFTYGSAPFSATSTADIQYPEGNANYMMQLTLINTSENFITHRISTLNANAYISLADANSAIKVTPPTNGLTGGTGATIQVCLWYTVVTL